MSEWCGRCNDIAGLEAEIERLNRDVEFWKNERDVSVNHAVTFGPEIAKRGAEIERLQADTRRWSKVADERSKENCALRQENERLRAALTTIASFDDLHGTQKLAATGSYSGFDEPESTKFARKVLGDLEQGGDGNAKT